MHSLFDACLMGQGGGGGGSDPHFASVQLLMHYNGSNGSTAFTDVKGHTITNGVGGLLENRTANPKFGSGSGWFNNPTAGSGATGIRIDTPGAIDFNLLSNDFTIEAWVYPFDLTANRDVVSQYITGNRSFEFGHDNRPFFRFSNNGSTDALLLYGPAMTANAWHHIAAVRNGSNFYVFTDGVSSSGSSASGIKDILGNPLYIGRNSDGSWGFNGYMDELRITKGVARYTSNFSVPTAAFPDS